ncbi:MAG: imidazoleglycerol-phosphate dehydratase HisB [Armatimonadetes bacterium]|nr:imidazoleglycerol-phosphate dehydratase HisB [Armatimonadota bacterium]
MEARTAELTRATKETQITVRLDLDGAGESQIDTGIGFFDHMLDQVARHGLMNLTVEARGDLHIDPHHTIEDTGIALGQAIARAAGEKAGIARYGSAVVPLDEALILVSLDLSGRPFLDFQMRFSAESVGGFPVEMAEEFFRAVATHAGLTLHIRQLAGKNAHHQIEAAFKAFAKALDAATLPDPRRTGVPSTKGVL